MVSGLPSSPRDGAATRSSDAAARRSARRLAPTTAETYQPSASAPGPFDHVSGEQVKRLVRKLLDELPVQRDREILIKTYLEDQDKSAICEALGVDSAHYNRVLFRAKERFRELLTTAASQRGLKLVDN
jgi:RNA polymerase sigma-70 factor (ECF subfamily)